MQTGTSRFGDQFRFTLITDDPRLAAEADRAGVDRIGIDLEYLGKAERQAGLDTRISRHGWDDLSAVSKSLKHADVFVRLNPVHAGTQAEVEKALQLGAAVLMLPSFDTAEEVSRFTAIVRNRARVALLVETAPAITRIRQILAVPGIDEVMIGLNDLHIQLRVSNAFEVLASPLIDLLAAEVHRKGLPFGVGGIGRVGDQGMPIPTELVHAQYPRLGATSAWLSRSFIKGWDQRGNLTQDVRAVRERLTQWSSAAPEIREKAREDLARQAALWRRTSAAA
jgi:hypothetical protein